MATVSRGLKGKPRISAPKARPSSHTETWNLLSNAIREIHNHNAIKLSFEAVYRYAYTLVISKQGELLYTGVKSLVRENLDRLAREQIVVQFPSGSAADPLQLAHEGDQLLKAFNAVWEDHCSNMTKLKAVLAYMDRSYTEGAGVLPIYEAGLRLFLERILHSSQVPIQRHIVNTLLNQIRIEREGYAIHQTTVKACVGVFLDLHDEFNKPVYKQDFEPFFLRDSRAFFKAESETLTHGLSVSEYLQRVESRLTSEEHLTNYMLSPATWAELRDILEQHLITEQIPFVLGGLENMFEHDAMDDLSRLYRLLRQVPTGIPSLKRVLKDSITHRGRTINDGNSTVNPDPEDAEMGDEDGAAKGKGKGKERAPPAGQTFVAAQAWVEEVLVLKDKFDRILKNAFGSDHMVQASMIEAFESFIHANAKAPEFISLFIDENLKKGLKGKSDHEVDVVLDKTITLFRFVSEKDVFERYYKLHLAKRLLHGRSVSDDAERGMLAKLKVECGFQFTQKLEGMFNDIKLSAESNQLYKNHLERTGSQLAIAMNVTIMTSTFWPTLHSDTRCTLTAELATVMSSYEQFYLSRHSGRRLTWEPSLGSADVRIQFKTKAHDVNVATFALVILSLFEDVEEGTRLSYEHIKSATSISDVELKRHLQSLACAKYKVLRKHPPSREISTEDDFSFNESFTCPLQRFKIATISTRVENSDETRETRAHVEEERKHQTEACIVRIMKDRKTMQHNALIHEVTRQLSSRFQPNPNDIKKRVESLIEREYLARSAEDKRAYNYLA